MTEDMHRQMTELGESGAPDPDPAFATQLELKLRATRAQMVTSDVLRPRRWPATIAAVTFSVAVIAFGLATVDRSARPVSISAASGAQVHMPDGRVVDATAGLELPDGAVIEVDSSGSARIGELVLGPGQIAEITPEGVVLAEVDTGSSSVTSRGEASSPPGSDSDPGTSAVQADDAEIVGGSTSEDSGSGTPDGETDGATTTEEPAGTSELDVTSVVDTEAPADTGPDPDTDSPQDTAVIPGSSSTIDSTTASSDVVPTTSARGRPTSTSRPDQAATTRVPHPTHPADRTTTTPPSTPASTVASDVATTTTSTTLSPTTTTVALTTTTTTTSLTTTTAALSSDTIFGGL